ncbi:spore germination protein GerPB [Paenibacillus lutrae]|uniref:Uncharacterized protein n=1 Tax=Paenibacillus lutrae TaxID=2078573 RepID=A0A7X3FHN5_9BACL|nr:hypothetical protein [Paenibacillus lutrae]
MSWTIHQTITIQQLRVDAVSNSSVLQIGSAGSIRSLSNQYNTGGFTGPAPEPGKGELAGFGGSAGPGGGPGPAGQGPGAGSAAPAPLAQALCPGPELLPPLPPM